MLEKGDFVKVINFNEEELEEDNEIFIGEEGIIIEKDDRNIYLYNIVFFNKKMQKRSMELGQLYWREEDLMKIS